MPGVLAIVGMHRTGTSLLARYLFESGLFMGNDLLGPHASNPAGHYEDREFLALHNAILAAHDLDYKVSSPVEWNISAAFRNQAQALIAVRAHLAQWGWKDPRTCLFLPFWKSLLPECRFLITYRPFQPVVQSLIARDLMMYRAKTNRWQRFRDKRFTKTEIAQLSNTYLQVWIFYNSEILKHIIEDSTAHYTIVSFSDLVHGNFQCVPALKDNGFALHPPDHFESALSKSRQSYRLSVSFDPTLVQEAQAVDTRFRHALRSTVP